ncbi:MAG: 3-dehydroquinate dehydratase [Actinomycetota bacterium]|jgi:3-dehydroquinate dehydratase-2|nr:3-dehydroquinate dehydratase [Acidimicrobiales bacterium]MED5230159.1 type II 3-dehydroquinate dehydratase [Actinomycetota bacterium]MED5445928.1 type II 3-dehydroquinate dehydratase [Actinomycetota bacterium]GIS55761.1 MAG: 3-dehydroquinate dehydratase [Actinomycetota bacterium]|tara:strand:- start:451 stop:897 length:447 start_codon:yes stop_codon:yes gene_type:complete
MKSILLLMGPNLNMLGEREPEIYGSATMQDHIEDAEKVANEFGYELVHFQSNNEGDLVNQIHKARGKHTGIIINPGALTHYGWSIHDALLVYEGVIIEMHLSNPNQRESWRHTSVVAPVADGSIVGFGIQGYELSIRAFHQIIENDDK